MAKKELSNGFTLRLTEEEYQYLIEIKKLTGENTNASAIRFIIRNYREQAFRLENEIIKNSVLKKSYDEMKNVLNTFIKGLNNLRKIADVE